MFPVPEPYAAAVLHNIREVLNGEENDAWKLMRIWTVLCTQRGALLAILLRNTVGTLVQGGPFKGMRLTDALLAGTSAPTPHLLGSYEYELHPAIEAAIARPYAQVINIGCNYGYYAVGFARRMPDAQIHACDIEPDLVAQCRAMAALNGVESRMGFGGLFSGEDFARFPGRTLVLMDIEGAEIDLLDPVKYPPLQQMDIIVELHAVNDPALPDTVIGRFRATHDIEILFNKPALYDFGPMLGANRYIDPVDALIGNWESRAGPTPWGIFRVKSS